jgi:hypothetical protein
MVFFDTPPHPTDPYFAARAYNPNRMYPSMVRKQIADVLEEKRRGSFDSAYPLVCIGCGK